MLAPSPFDAGTPSPSPTNSDFPPEIVSAANYLVGHLLSHLPHTAIASFRTALLNLLAKKCSESWDPERPEKGSAHRAVSFIGGRADKVVERAAVESGIGKGIASYYPSELMWVGRLGRSVATVCTLTKAVSTHSLWCDPGEVSVRIGEYGQVQSLYRDPRLPPSRPPPRPPSQQEFLLPPLPEQKPMNKRSTPSFSFSSDDEPVNNTWVLPSATPRNKVRIRRPDEAQSSPVGGSGYFGARELERGQSSELTLI